MCFGDLKLGEQELIVHLPDTKTSVKGGPVNMLSHTKSKFSIWPVPCCHWALKEDSFGNTHIPSDRGGNTAVQSPNTHGPDPHKR